MFIHALNERSFISRRSTLIAFFHAKLAQAKTPVCAVAPKSGEKLPNSGGVRGVID
jgi:hypothetical protein